MLFITALFFSVRLSVSASLSADEYLKRSARQGFNETRLNYARLYLKFVHVFFFILVELKPAGRGLMHV